MPVQLPHAYPLARRGTLIVWGLLAAYPFGGMTWQALHYLAGLRRLGFDVWYVEDSDRTVLDPTTLSPTTNPAPNVEYLARFMEKIGLGDRWVFRLPQTNTCRGARDVTGLAVLYEEADAVLNLCGAQELRDEHGAISTLVYIETDPVRNQVAAAKGDEATIQELSAYDYLFTYGTNLGAPDCQVPVTRYDWHSTRPPVCLDWWSAPVPSPQGAALTTVANWKHSGKDVKWQGEAWRWSKHHEFLRVLDLPSQSALPLELALGAATDAEEERLRACGWRVIPSARLADPARYRAYIRDSLGEFTVAKEQYARPRSGWFSDRSVCYLAAGRPVITQATGFEKELPTGEGLFSFATTDEAAAATDAVARDYTRHAEAAREIAHAFFDAERVLRAMLRTIELL